MNSDIISSVEKTPNYSNIGLIKLEYYINLALINELN
jgi:hypothetical protein